MIDTHRSLLSKAIARLRELPVEQAGLGMLVLNGLQELVSTPLPGTSWGTTPFTEHFFQELATLPHEDESHWLALFEDLVILFRERALEHPGKLMPAGQAILVAFEGSALWTQGDGSLISEWYWEKLPALYARSTLAAQG